MHENQSSFPSYLQKRYFLTLTASKSLNGIFVLWRSIIWGSILLASQSWLDQVNHLSKYVQLCSLFNLLYKSDVSLMKLVYSKIIQGFHYVAQSKRPLRLQVFHTGAVILVTALSLWLYDDYRIIILVTFLVILATC